MGLWSVIPELRARGVHVNLAAWYPFYEMIDPKVMIDSETIFMTGPVAGIRKVHDATALGLPVVVRGDG